MPVSSRLEAELSELDDEDADAMRADLGVSESGLQRVVRGAYDLLELIAFFTAGEDEAGAVVAHAPRRDGVARGRARSTPTSSAGFVRAEVIAWDALVDAGGYAAARDRGTLRLEGRDYAMRDGDVITVKLHAVGTSSTASSSIRAPLVSSSAACSARRGSAR